ncbi:MAG: hypothetical protein RL654_111 [Pseudomonadota bacterium]|jgi:predicted dinucleotide-utilizing enzyme
MQDIRNTLDYVQSLPPAARTATVNGTSVDTTNYGSAAVIFEMGALTDGTHTPSVQDSDDNTNFTTVSASGLIGALSNLAANTVQKVGYIGTKRYVRPVLTIAGATTGAVSSAIVVGGDCRKAPV